MAGAGASASAAGVGAGSAAGAGAAYDCCNTNEMCVQKSSHLLFPLFYELVKTEEDEDRTSGHEWMNG